VGQTPGHVAEDAGAQCDTGGHSWIVLGLAGEPERQDVYLNFIRMNR